MDLTPKFRSKYEEFRVLDAHTEGEPARIILSGIPVVEGTTMMEKKQFFMEHCDDIRTSLCFEPRGHRDMIAQGDTFEYYSILGRKFTCRIDRTTKVGDFYAIVPVITGGAYIDGYNCWLIGPDDPFKDGFLLGM